jgi:hypothetical protein
MGQEKEVKAVGLKGFIKMVAASKQMTVTEAANASGREQCTLSNIMKQGNTSLKVLNEVLSGMDEDLVLCTKDGQKYKIVIE